MTIKVILKWTALATATLVLAAAGLVLVLWLQNAAPAVPGVSAAEAARADKPSS